MTDPIRFHERYDPRHLPAMPLACIGRSAQVAARPGLSPHSHDVFEVCLLEDGEVHWFVDDRRVSVPPGGAFLTRPGETHGSEIGMLQPCTLRWLMVRFDLCDSPNPGDAASRDSRDTSPVSSPSRGAMLDAGLAESLTRMPSMVPRVERRLFDLHDQMLLECRELDADKPALLTAMLQHFLVLLVRQARDTPRRHMPPSLRRAVEAIDNDPEHPWSLGELQDVSGLGRSRMHDLFKTHLGESPTAHALRRRLGVAQQLLRETRLPITDIAHRLSFSSSQHFANAFRNRYGTTPTQCRRDA